MTAQKSQKAQKGQKGRKTNFKSRRRDRRAATPARLLPALRQTAHPGCGVSPCFQALGMDRPPAALRVLSCGRGAGVDAVRPSAGFLPLIV